MNTKKETHWREYQKLAEGKKPYKPNKKIHGMGVNDANYVILLSLNGKRIKCPIYQKWEDMLKRCFSEKYHKKRPTYRNVKCCVDWLTFSNFRQWFILNWRPNCQLDKDFLSPDNKIYSPETCVFIPQHINSLFRKGKGYSYDKSKGSYKALISADKNRVKHLGYFKTEKEARHAYLKAKILRVRKVLKQYESDLDLRVVAKINEILEGYKQEIFEFDNQLKLKI